MTVRSGRFAWIVLAAGLRPSGEARAGPENLHIDSLATAVDTLATARPPILLPATLRWTDLLREDEVLVFEPGDTRRPLRQSFLQFGSESITAGDSLLVRNRDYGIDYSRGAVFLLARATEQITMRVRYLYLPAPRQRTYRAAAIETREMALARANPDATVAGAGVDPLADADRDGAPRQSAARDLPPGLQLAGSNSIGVSFGRNREASLDQSLRVEASGAIGEGLRVNAVLADDNLPVTAEGSTEELGDLNKVFIEMQGPVVGGVLGDYSLARSQGDLVDVQRELRGGEVRLQGKGQALAIGAGLAKGEFVTTSFRGTEGKQGPYDLLSARRIDLSTIVPGSERVYADGRLLRRGENQDYIVDYDRGELRFTSRQRITADTEITVDFQVNGAGYRRTSTDARFDGKARGLQIRGLVLSEGDDRDAPAAGAYDADEVAALQAAGDRAVLAPGIRDVPPGRGLYRRDLVDSTIVRYDPIAGDLEVDFYETPAGAYDDSLDALTGRRFFVHRGPGQGAFDIGRQLTPASWLRLASTQVVATPARALRLAGEASVSGFDANSFSALDDANNTGEAIDLRFDAGRHADPTTGRFGAKLHVSQLSPRFHAPGRARAPFYYKDWNAETDSLQSTERIVEATVGAGLGGERPWLRLDANAGRLDRGDDLATDRAQVDFGLGRGPDRGLDVRVQALDSERPRLGPEANRTRGFFLAGGRYRLWRFLPEVRLERDAFVRADIDSTARESYRYVDLSGRLGLLETRGTSVAVDVGRRTTDAPLDAAARAAGAGEWVPSRRNDTVGLHLLARPTTSIATELDISRRTNEPLGPTGGAETRSDLARAVIGWNPRDRAARIEWRHELSEEAVRTLQQVLVLAPDGKGDFDAEGRPVGRDLGTYDKVVRYTADAEPVAQVESSLRLELGGFGGWSADDADSTTSWVRRNVSLVQVLAVKEQTRSDRIGALAALWPSAFQTTSTVFGNFRARQEWSFLNASRHGALKLFLDFQNGLDARLADNPIEDRERTATLRFERTSVARWTWGGETGVARRLRSGQLDGIVIGRPSSGSFEVTSVRALGRVGWRFTASERVGIDFETMRQNDALSATQQTLFTATPAATLAPTRNLRFLASAALTRVLEDKPAASLAPYFFDPPGTKASMSLLGSYRLGRSLQFNITYNGVRSTDGRFNYDAKAETRAIF